MKIKRGDIYYIELYLEPGKISDHNKRSNGTLSFTGVELMDAIVSAGMPDTNLYSKYLHVLSSLLNSSQLIIVKFN